MVASESPYCDVLNSDVFLALPLKHIVCILEGSRYINVFIVGISHVIRDCIQLGLATTNVHSARRLLGTFDRSSALRRFSVSPVLACILNWGPGTYE